MKKAYRRKYLVDSSYQFSQAGAVIAANVLVALLMAGLLSWFYLLEWNGNLVYDHNRLIPIYILTLILIVTLGTTLLSLRRSRIIAGMIKKLHSVLSDAGQGILPERAIRFRRSDYFGQLAVPLNRCLERLRHREAREDALLTALHEIAARAERQPADNPELLRDLQAVIARFAAPDAEHAALGATPDSGALRS